MCFPGGSDSKNIHLQCRRSWFYSWVRKIPWRRDRLSSVQFSSVALFYGTITFIYVMPKSSYSTEQNKVLSLFYTVVIPMLNPLIDSLRNRDVKEALRKASVRIYS